jgi:hypothetical protein
MGVPQAKGQERDAAIERSACVDVLGPRSDSRSKQQPIWKINNSDFVVESDRVAGKWIQKGTPYETEQLIASHCTAMPVDLLD